MSADNGIYIAQFQDGYRVAHAQAIENIDYYSEGDPERIKVIKQYFGKSEVYDTIDKAIDRANEIHQEVMEGPYPVVEYGIGLLGKLPLWEQDEHDDRDK